MANISKAEKTQEQRDTFASNPHVIEWFQAFHVLEVYNVKYQFQLCYLVPDKKSPGYKDSKTIRIAVCVP